MCALLCSASDLSLCQTHVQGASTRTGIWGGAHERARHERAVSWAWLPYWSLILSLNVACSVCPLTHTCTTARTPNTQHRVRNIPQGSTCQHTVTQTRARACTHTHTHTHTHTMQTWEHRKVRAGKIIAGKGIECLRPSRARYGSVLAVSGREKSRRACTGEQEGRNRRRRGLAERDQCTDGSKRQAAAKDHARARTFRPGPARRLHARALFVSTREGR